MPLKRILMIFTGILILVTHITLIVVTAENPPAFERDPLAPILFALVHIAVIGLSVSLICLGSVKLVATAKPVHVDID